MDVFEIGALIAQQGDSRKKYLEFLRVPSMSLGLYVLPAGGADQQVPHTEDEAYYVIEGRAVMRIGDQDRVVSAGSVIFVAANVEHRFHDIEEDLKVLVFFAPAEYTQANKA